MNVDHVADRVADTALLVSAAGTVAAVWSLDDVLKIVQIGAGCVAILSGLCAAFYYLVKATSKQ
jgi:hypothetical protein